MYINKMGNLIYSKKKVEIDVNNNRIRFPIISPRHVPMTYNWALGPYYKFDPKRVPEIKKESSNSMIYK